MGREFESSVEDMELKTLGVAAVVVVGAAGCSGPEPFQSTTPDAIVQKIPLNRSNIEIKTIKGFDGTANGAPVGTPSDFLSIHLNSTETELPFLDRDNFCIALESKSLVPVETRQDCINQIIPTIEHNFDPFGTYLGSEGSVPNINAEGQIIGDASFIFPLEPGDVVSIAGMPIPDDDFAWAVEVSSGSIYISPEAKNQIGNQLTDAAVVLSVLLAAGFLLQYGSEVVGRKISSSEAAHRVHDAAEGVKAGVNKTKGAVKGGWNAIGKVIPRHKKK